MKERWKDVVGYEGLYQVSTAGRVKSLPTKYHPRVSILKPWPQTDQKYPFVHLSRDRVRVGRSVHSLVAEAFLGPRPSGKVVCHRDGDGSNSILSNLRYGTQSSNMVDREAHGTCVTPGAKLKHRQVLRIRCRLENGDTVSALAREYGVTSSLIYMIRDRKIWKGI